MQLVKEKGIAFVYGSDSHSLTDVGRGYDAFVQDVEVENRKRKIS